MRPQIVTGTRPQIVTNTVILRLTASTYTKIAYSEQISISCFTLVLEVDCEVLVCSTIYILFCIGLTFISVLWMAPVFFA